MSTRQVVVAALVIAGTCCAVMWFLEEFNRQRMAAEFRDWLESLPTREGAGGAGA